MSSLVDFFYYTIRMIFFMFCIQKLRKAQSVFFCPRMLKMVKMSIKVIAAN